MAELTFARITDLYEEITHTKIDRRSTKYLMLEPTATDLDGEDVNDLPLVVFWFSKPKKA